MASLPDDDLVPAGDQPAPLASAALELFPHVPERRMAWSWPLAGLLFVLTFFFTTTLGALWSESEGIPADEALWASPTAIRHVWGDPDLLARGLAYALPVLFILLCHELGHYLACRHYQLPATPPYFLPSPLGLGTLGAFIRVRAPIRTKQQLFDVGVAGPLAGFVALVPFLLWGVAHSRVTELPVVAAEDGRAVLVLGTNLALAGAIQLFHGDLGNAVALELHPAALAAWVGLLATALNLIPLGQLDGGHVFYAAAGRWQWKLARPLWVVLLAAGLLWPVWWVWGLLLLLTGLAHPPVRDEDAPLGTTRRWLAVATLVIFVLSFMPVPVGAVFVD